MRTLFVMKDSPYPPLSGAPLRNWLNVNAMAQLGPVAVFSVGTSDHNGASIPDVASWIHHERGVRPRSSVALGLSYLRRIARPREYPIFDDRAAPAITASLREMIERFRPDITVITNWQHALPAPLRELRGRLIVDAHNIESLATSQTLRSSHDPALIARGYLRQPYVTAQERRLFEHADQAWFTSEADAAYLRRLTSRPPPHYIIPNAVDVGRYEAVRNGVTISPDSLGKRSHTICYVGTFAHQPNVQAAEILIREILPKLRQTFSDARLLLVGREPTSAMIRAAQPDSGIYVTGTVPDTRPYLAAADVTIVPLTHGGGTRLKILEAFAAGLPVVSTSKGCEGLGVRDCEHLLVRDDPGGIVEATAALWNDPQRARDMSDRAWSLVSREYSWDAVFGKVREAVGTLFASA